MRSCDPRFITSDMRRISELMNLAGRKALVTGGAGHIGLAAEEVLVELGATLAVLDLDRDACETRARELSKDRSDCAIAVSCDLSDERATRKAVRQVVEELGGLDILVHSAGYLGTPGVPGWSVPFERQTVEAWDAAMRVNLTAAFAMVQEAQDSLAASGAGSVIFVSSIYGVVGPDMRLYEGTPMAHPAAYAASKGGLVQLMRYLATVLAPRIRVNTVSPGGVWREPIPMFQDRYVSRTPLNRMATEEDLKGAIAYLSSNLSAYVTGQNLLVDGGWTAW